MLSFFSNSLTLWFARPCQLVCGLKRTEEFRQEAVRIALTSGLARKQVADDLGVGMSTLKNGSWHIGTLTWCRKIEKQLELKDRELKDLESQVDTF